MALDPDGAVVAFCTAWPDETNRCGVLEPVGTVPAHRRRGLARAVCLDALLALRAAGMTRARVGFGTAPAESLYRSLGFGDCRADAQYRRDRAYPPRRQVACRLSGTRADMRARRPAHR